MTRDDFLSGELDDTTCAPGRRLFVIAVKTTDVRQTERSVRQMAWDYLGSNCTGVRLLEDQPSTDQVIDS